MHVGLEYKNLIPIYLEYCAQPAWISDLEYSATLLKNCALDKIWKVILSIRFS